MFREYVHRIYQTLVRGRKWRTSRSWQRSRQSVARLAVESLEDRTLLSTLTLTSGALIYSPNTFVANSLSMSHNAATHRYTFVDTAEDITLVGNFSSPSGDFTHTVSFGDGNINSITVNMFNQDFTVGIEQTLANVPVTVNLGNGNDDVYVSPSARNLNNIQGAITIHGGLGQGGIEIFDQSNPAAQSFSMGAGSLSRSGAATISYTAVNFVSVHAGNGDNVFNVSSTALTTALGTGNGHDTVNVNGTGFGGTFQVNEGTGMDTVNVRASDAAVYLVGGGQDTVNVGNAGSVQAIYGSLTISDAPSLTTINVDDSADTTPRTVSLDTVGSDYGSISGLAPAQILYKYADTYTLTAQTGTGGATVNVLATGKPVNLVGHGPNTTVNVGNAGSVQQIMGALAITDPPSYTAVNVDDSADNTSRIVGLGTVMVSGASFGSITGLAPAAIQYKYADTSAVTVQTNIATLNVRATGVPVNLIGHGGNTVNVGNAGSVQAINGSLTISNPPSFTTLNLDDSADAAALTVTLDTVTIDSSNYGRITGLAPAAILYNYSDTYTVTVQTGGSVSGATVNVLATGVPVNLIGQGHDTVNVGNAGSVQAITGALTISNPPSFTTLNVDESADGTTPIVTLDTVTINGSAYGIITGLAPAAIQYKYADTNTVTVLTGTGGASVNALTTGKPVNLIGNPSGPISLFASDADNNWTITSQNAGTLSSALLVGTVTFSGTANLLGGNGADTFVFTDGAGLDGTIDGGGGTNTLDYSSYSSSVLVDLQTGSGTGVGQGIASIQNITGGNGGGGGVYNILVGNGGNVLTGGDGRRNLLIAGASASTLIGGNDDDILIGGTTAYDTEVGLASLQAIMNYWSSTADDYGTRVGNLLSGSGVPLLDATMVTNNGGGNTLIGNHGGAGEMNLFYGLDPTLETTDYNPGIGEQFINC